MPKIYGDVRYDISARQLYCNDCKYSWTPTQQELYRANNGYKVTCPLCRTLKDFKVEERFGNKNKFMVSKVILKTPVNILRVDSTANILIPIFSCNCKHRMYVKAGDLNDFSMDPVCWVCNPAKNPYKNNTKENQAKPSTNKKPASSLEMMSRAPKKMLNKQSEKVVKPTVYPVTQPDIKQESKVKESKVKESNINKLIYNREDTLTPMIKPIEVIDINIEESEDFKALYNKIRDGKLTKAKAEKIRNDRETYNTLTTKLQSLVGKTLNNASRLVDVDSDNDQFTYQCIHCGTEYTGLISEFIAMNSDNRASKFVCSSCSKLLEINDKKTLDLIQHYIGKIYNGLKIIKVYEDKDGAKCDVECTSKFDGELTTEMLLRHDRGHITEGLNLGDVINQRCICEVCQRKSIDKIRSIMLRLDCKARSRMLNSGYNDSMFRPIKGITYKDLYTSDKYICDYCSMRDTCDEKDRLEYNLRYIASSMDEADTIKESISSVGVDFPSIYSTNNKESRQAKADKKHGLIIFKDAYIGNDGQLYKFCKCIEHGTNLIISQNEIAGFKHDQCLRNYNKYMDFYDLDLKFLMSSGIADKDKK